MMPDGDVEAFEAWRLKAEEDFAAASIPAEHGGPGSTICFLCQQVSEKYLKGYLLFRRQPLQRIHHLDVVREVRSQPRRGPDRCPEYLAWIRTLPCAVCSRVSGGATVV
jgi:HEPN domain-containing protein